eukprot:scaffold119993_cov63-Phaeocystis_antarctica.AAC.2
MRLGASGTVPPARKRRTWVCTMGACCCCCCMSSTGSHHGGHTTGCSTSTSLLATLNFVMCGMKAAEQAAAMPKRARGNARRAPSPASCDGGG